MSVVSQVCVVVALCMIVISLDGIRGELRRIATCLEVWEKERYSK